MAIVTAKDLRMWHWRKVLTHRKAAEFHAKIFYAPNTGKVEGTYRWRMMRQNNKQADFHLSAVQILNDHPDLIGTTAEQDCKNG